MSRLARLRQEYTRIKQSLQEAGQQLADDGKVVYQRALGERVVIGVTGLSRSGKSAFITSFIQQLTQLSSARLAGFGAAVSGRITAVEVHQNDAFEKFDFDQALDALTAQPRRWPDATTDITSTELHIFYQHVKSKPAKRIIVELVDYPGELLFDLSMLALDFSQWSTHWLKLNSTGEKHCLTKNFTQLDDDEATHSLHHEQFVLALKQLKQAGYSQVSPGHMLLTPDAYADRDKLFVPYIGRSQTLRAMYEANYERYKAQELKHFVTEVFNRQDRQIVLVDLLQSLTKGEQVFDDQRAALELIVGHTNYAKQNRLINAIKPKVNRVVFACTKADQVLSGDHDDLRQLLFEVIKSTYEAASVVGVSPICEAIAAIRSSQEIDHKGSAVIAGESIDQAATVGYANPGILTHIPETKEEWGAYTDWQYRPLAPPIVGRHKAFPHIRMDSVMNHLLEDLL